MVAESREAGSCPFLAAHVPALPRDFCGEPPARDFARSVLDPPLRAGRFMAEGSACVRLPGKLRLGSAVQHGTRTRQVQKGRPCSPNRTPPASGSSNTNIPIWKGFSPYGAFAHRHADPRLLRVLKSTQMVALGAPHQSEKDAGKSYPTGDEPCLPRRDQRERHRPAPIDTCLRHGTHDCGFPRRYKPESARIYRCPGPIPRLPIT